ncbi:PTS lactose/cellobiose transporter subunit IIA [Agrilactobacillus fermenti]|uniref:PTS lactose/cellobiose transporter subunit IIA n=1 Tax=Agrilactobacillus fermenti TaxID=2586909 RepID=UPI003A5C773A
MTEEDSNLQVTMQLIISGGNAKGAAMEAINAAKVGDFDEAEKKLKAADKFLSEAHNAQTGMLTEEAQGHHAEVNLLMVHGQDHVMNAITFRDLAGQMVDLYKRIKK